MTKYTLINSKTKEEHVCRKIEVNGYHYYVLYGLITELNQNLQKGDWVYSAIYGLGRVTNDYGGKESDMGLPIIVKYEDTVTMQQYHRSGIWQKDMYYDVSAHNCKKVIATNNPNIEIPKITDGVSELSEKEYADQEKVYETSTDMFPFNDAALLKAGFVGGYRQSQKTHPFSEEDMAEFAEWIADPKLHGHSKQLREAMIKHKVSTTKELLQVWKEQRPKTILFT